MGDIDNTRDRLKLDNLEQNTRKDLFNKFVDAGGEVIAEKKKPNTGVIGGSRRSNTLVGGSSSDSKSKSDASSSKSSSSDNKSKSKTSASNSNTIRINNNIFS